MTDKPDEPCGCVVIYACGQAATTPSVDVRRCPLHAAAGQMAEALEKLTQRVALWKRGVAEGVEVVAISEEAEAALAAAGRGK